MGMDYKRFLIVCNTFSVLVLVSVLKSVESSCKDTGTCQVTFTVEELKRRLTPLQYAVTQEHSTERGFTGKLLSNKREGIYKCAVCGNGLFSSSHKFDSGTGWPSFFDVLDQKAVTRTRDTSFGWIRTEISCSRCGAHLGHVFDDGPPPTGKRYCMNSAALDFEAAKKTEATNVTLP